MEGPASVGTDLDKGFRKHDSDPKRACAMYIA